MQEQVHTINIIGAAVAPKIKIGDGSGEFEVSHSGKNKIQIENLSNFDIPVIIEMDREFCFRFDGQILNRALIPKNETISCTVTSEQGSQRQHGKLKIYFDGKEKTILDWVMVKNKIAKVELSGPLEMVSNSIFEMGRKKMWVIFCKLTL